MSDDLIKKASYLETMGYTGGNFKDRYLDIGRIVAELVVEIKRLRADNSALLDALVGGGANITILDAELKKQLVAKEPSIQIDQKVDYLERLEKDYIKWAAEYYKDLGETVAMSRARAALSKIQEDKT
jgi:hypothetical protein